MPRRTGLHIRHRANLRALLPPLLGVPHDTLALGAVLRIDDFLRALPDASARRDLRLAVAAVDLIAVAWGGRSIGAMDGTTVRQFVQHLWAPAEVAPPSVLDRLSSVSAGRIPSQADLARAIRELLTLAYWSQPDAAALTGWVPPWARPAVLAADPEAPLRHPLTTPDRRRLDLAAIAQAQRPEVAPGRRWFAGDGRPRVAILGGGAAGCVVAAKLAPRFDVAVWEAGPRLLPETISYDPMAAMALSFDRALMAPTRDLDVRILAARALGGGSALNEGVYHAPPRGLLLRWRQDGAPIDLRALDQALDEVRRRQRLVRYAPDLLTGPSLRFEAAARRRPGFEVELLHSDLVTTVESGRDERSGWVGSRCLGCGQCNHGCRWGHHRSADRTWLWDAERAGARVWVNQPVRRLVARRGATGVDVRGLELQGDASVVEADAIVLAAGAIGSPALLLRSLPGSPLGALPMRRRVGRGFGFNYGSPVIARFDDPFARPGWDGLQVGFVVRPEGSDTWIAENGFIEPGLIASCTPGIGALHRSWMADTAHLAMAVNTVGSLPSGVVGADGRVSYRLGRTELDTVRASLAELVDLYLSAGASQVALGGVGGLASSTHFTARDRGLPGAILGRIERAFPSADWLALASGHPQGGLALGRVAAESVTGPDFRVHGTSNLFVADASLFPTPITVNPQWLVQALAVLASEAVQGAFACPVDAP